MCAPNTTVPIPYGWRSRYLQVIKVGVPDCHLHLHIIFQILNKYIAVGYVIIISY